MAKTKEKTYTIQLSSMRKININAFKGAEWIHINDDKKGNHVTLGKKD